MCFVSGAIWFGPLFGKKWMNLIKMSDKDKKNAQKGMFFKFITQFVAALITSFVLAFFIGAFGAKDATTGALIGFVAWAGFVATTTIGNVLWENKPMELWFINNGHMLLEFLAIGALLAVMS